MPRQRPRSSQASRDVDFRNNGNSSGICWSSVGRNVGRKRQLSLRSGSHSQKQWHRKGSYNRCCGLKLKITAYERLWRWRLCRQSPHAAQRLSEEDLEAKKFGAFRLGKKGPTLRAWGDWGCHHGTFLNFERKQRYLSTTFWERRQCTQLDFLSSTQMNRPQINLLDFFFPCSFWKFWWKCMIWNLPF